MKSRKSLGSLASLTALLALYGCGAPEGGAKAQNRTEDLGWITAPRVEAVVLRGRQATITGQATPEARVLLRGDEGETYAVNADSNGGFEIVLTLTDDQTLLSPEVQQGQELVKGPERLLLLSQAELAVMQTEGGSSRRLSPAPRLDAIDGDGQALVASGRSRPNQPVKVAVQGGFETVVQSDSMGRWAVSLAGVKNQPVSVLIGDQSFAYPGPGKGLSAGEDEDLVAVAGGWRLTRRVGPQSVLTTWFPNP